MEMIVDTGVNSGPYVSASVNARCLADNAIRICELLAASFM
jgi:hypothetical protein